MGAIRQAEMKEKYENNNSEEQENLFEPSSKVEILFKR